MNRRLLAATIAGALLFVAPVQAFAANKNSKFCKTAIKIDKMDSVFSADWDPTKNPKQAAKDLKTAAQALKQLESDSPAKLKGDVKAIRGFFEKFAVVLPKFPTGASANDPAKLAKVLTELTPILAEAAKLEARTAKLTKFLSSECGIKP